MVATSMRSGAAQKQITPGVSRFERSNRCLAQQAEHGRERLAKVVIDHGREIREPSCGSCAGSRAISRSV